MLALLEEFKKDEENANKKEESSVFAKFKSYNSKTSKEKGKGKKQLMAQALYFIKYGTGVSDPFNFTDGQASENIRRLGSTDFQGYCEGRDREFGCPVIAFAGRVVTGQLCKRQ